MKNPATDDERRYPNNIEANLDLNKQSHKNVTGQLIIYKHSSRSISLKVLFRLAGKTSFPLLTGFTTGTDLMNHECLRKWRAWMGLWRHIQQSKYYLFFRVYSSNVWCNVVWFVFDRKITTEHIVCVLEGLKKCFEVFSYFFNCFVVKTVKVKKSIYHKQTIQVKNT